MVTRVSCSSLPEALRSLAWDVSALSGLFPLSPVSVAVGMTSPVSSSMIGAQEPDVYKRQRLGGKKLSYAMLKRIDRGTLPS